MSNGYGSDRRSKKFAILVVEANEDHRSLIDLSLQESLPEVKSLLMSSAQEALTYLTDCTRSSDRFPNLLLLDVCLPDPEQGWDFLDKVRKTYQRLPVIVFSAHQSPEAVRTAYDLGAHSFIGKPMTSPEWVTYFKSLGEYWLRTVTLPRTYVL